MSESLLHSSQPAAAQPARPALFPDLSTLSFQAKVAPSLKQDLRDNVYRHLFTLLTEDEQAGILVKVLINREGDQDGMSAISGDELRQQLLRNSTGERGELFTRVMKVAPGLQAIAQELLLECLSSFYEGFPLALEHLLRGGRVGFLSARSSRKACEPLLDAIRGLLGHNVPENLSYFVNDETLNAGVRHHGSTPERKLQVLLNLSCPYKIGPDGEIATSSKAHRRVTLIDDEIGNVRSVRRFLAEEAVKHELERSYGIVMLPQTVKKHFSFLLGRYKTAGAGRPLNGPPNPHYPKDEDLLHRALIRALWKRAAIWNGANDIQAVLVSAIDPRAAWLRVFRLLDSERPIRFGSKRHLLLADIDGTLCELPGCEYVRVKNSPPEQEPLLTITRARIKEGRPASYWLQLAAQRTGRRAESLYIDYGDFDKADRVRRLVAQGVRHNAMFRKKLPE